MIKRFLFFVSACLIGSPIFGQGVKLGVFFDPTISWLKSDVSDVKRDAARLGFDFGLMTDIYFAPNYAFSTGLSLFNVGGTLLYANGINLDTKDGNKMVSPGGTVKYRVQYLKIPLGMKLQTNLIGRLIYYANLGLDPMIRITSKANFYSDGVSYKGLGVNNEIKLFNIGYHIGGGVQYPLDKNTSLLFGLTFMNMFADMTSHSHDRITVNNLVFCLGVVF